MGVAYNGTQQTGGLVSLSPPVGDLGGCYFYHSDHLGSSSMITDVDGNVVQHIEYVPYGEVFVEERNSTWSTPYKFNAKQLDEETGLYYYGARYYDPRTSVWLSVDPLAEKYVGWSAYNYCMNNPVRFTDPTGMGSEDETYKMTGVEAGKKYGTVAVLPLNLNGDNGAMQERYNEAIKNGIPVIQVKDRNALASAMKEMKSMKTTTNSYMIVGHGSPGSIRIGDESLSSDKDFTNASLSMLKEGFKGKNIILTHCNVTKNSDENGMKRVRLFGRLTGANAVLSNDHLGLSLMNLNSSEKGFWGITSDFPFVRRENGDGMYFNDFHLYLNGNHSPNPKPAFNARLDIETGSIIFNPSDNVTTGDRTADR